MKNVFLETRIRIHFEELPDRYLEMIVWDTCQKRERGRESFPRSFVELSDGISRNGVSAKRQRRAILALITVRCAGYGKESGFYKQ